MRYCIILFPNEILQFSHRQQFLEKLFSSRLFDRPLFKISRIENKRIFHLKLWLINSKMGFQFCQLWILWNFNLISIQPDDWIEIDHPVTSLAKIRNAGAFEGELIQIKQIFRLNKIKYTCKSPTIRIKNILVSRQPSE